MKKGVIGTSPEQVQKKEDQFDVNALLRHQLGKVGKKQ